MNLLLVNQFFPPDPAPTGLLLADLAGHLASLGHQVTVVCGRSGRSPLSATPNLTVRRLPTLPFAHGPAARLLSYAGFYLGALRCLLTGPRPDLVLTLTTPPLLSVAGALAKRLRGSRFSIWEMDVYPDVAVALGAFRPRSLATRLAAALADWSRRQADAVIALGPCMRHRLCAHGLPPSRIQVVENWADSQTIRPLPLPSFPPLTLLYSGNLGLAHDSDTLAALIAALQHDRRFLFAVSGGGPRRARLERLCRHLPNVRFSGYQDSAALSEHLASCHLGLVTQRPETLGAVVPSKIYALMAAGRPVLFIGPRASTAAQTLLRFRCGWQIDPGDLPSGLGLLDLLAANSSLLFDTGRRARAAFLAHCDRPNALHRLVEILDPPGLPNEPNPVFGHAPCPQP